jgi:hypothetical protein
MMVERWLILGMALYVTGASIAIVALAVHGLRTSQYSREVDVAIEQADAATARGDFAEAHRILDAAKAKRP